MPELPEVETTVAGLRDVLEGAQLTLVEPRRADLRWPIPVDLRQRMTGARVTGLSRRAKYGLIATDRGDTMIFHLGMSGRWRVDPGEYAWIMDSAARRSACPSARVRSACTIRPLRFSIRAWPMKQSMAPVPGDFL